jgi:hypothetical protein
MVPARFVVQTRLPMTGNDKTDLAALGPPRADPAQ